MSNEWRLIETAPKDGTRILVYRPGSEGHKTGIDRWKREYKSWYHSKPANPPRYWMPLPRPPK